MVFGRKDQGGRRGAPAEDAGQATSGEAGEVEEAGVTEETEDAAQDQSRERAGPWDSADSYPPGERYDCGSLLIPLREGIEIQVGTAAELGAWVAIIVGESGMQLQAFAAPKSSGLWDEVRSEIAESITAGGGEVFELAGPFGPELAATVPMAEREDEPPQPVPMRFWGADGPRWFLHGVISGPAAADPAAAATFRDVFADVVVVRGDQPEPPREQLAIRLPEEEQAAIDAQLAESQGWELPSVFERGPEITEIR